MKAMGKLAGSGIVTAAALAAALALGLGSGAQAAKPTTGKVAGVVKVQKGGKPKPNMSGVVITLEGVPAAPVDAASLAHAEIRQRGKQFTPQSAVVVKGTVVDFPNEDKVFHNVFSMSKPARFDLGLYKSGASKSVTFKKSGVVDIYCNIHPDMVAKVKVVDDRFHAVTAADGSFAIPDVPAGSYPIVAWQANGKEYRGTVEVKVGATTRVALDLVEDSTANTVHQRKDGTPYGRYD